MRCTFLLLLLSVLLHPIAHAGDGVFSGGEDFTDFAPKYSEDQTHLEESFLYFERRDILTAATGLDSFTGALGSGLSSSYPVLDLRLAHFFDFRRALELRLNNSRFTGSLDNSLLDSMDLSAMRDSLTTNNNFFELNFFRLGLGIKYYTANEAPETRGIDNQTVWSPNFFFSTGLNYARFGILMPSTRLEDSIDVVIPHVSMGTDFFLKNPGMGNVKRPPTFSLEAQYTLIGSWLRMIGAQNTSGRNSIGDLLSLRTGVNFVF